MTSFKNVLCTAKTHTTSGPDGASHTSHGRLDIKLSTLGSPSAGANPEQFISQLINQTKEIHQ